VVSRGVYSARVAAQAALGSRGVFPNPSFIDYGRVDREYSKEHQYDRRNHHMPLYYELTLARQALYRSWVAEYIQAQRKTIRT